MLAFFGVQLSQTLLDVNSWPFCSYDMFSFLAPLRGPRLAVVFHETSGAYQVQPPGRLVPLESFRANQVLLDVYARSDDTVRAARLSRILLDRVNAEPWSSFDETLAAARPRSQAPFVGFDIIAQTVDLGSYRHPEPPRVVATYTLYSYHQGSRAPR